MKFTAPGLATAGHNLAAPFVVDVDIDTKIRARVSPPGCKCRITDKKTCDACWKTILRPQLLILHFLFGPKVLNKRGILSDYSGNKGFHFWVLQEDMWTMTEHERVRLKRMIQTAPKPGEPLFDLVQKETRIPATTWWYTWPTLDEAVGQSATQHLCKLFLLPHATTEKVAWPIVSPETFLPSNAPHYKNVTADSMKQMGDYIVGKIRQAKNK